MREAPSGRGRGEGLSIRWVAVMLVLVTAVQLGHTILQFEPVSGILNDEALYPLDYAIGYYLVESGKQRFQETGHFHGYDPYFMAGYPALHLENNHILLTVLASIVFPFLSTGLFIKLFYLVALTAAPLAFYVTLRNFDVGRRGAVVGMLLALTYIRVGEFVYTEAGGSLCGMLVFLFTLPYLSFFHRFLRCGDRSSLVWFAAMTPLLPVLHKSFVVIAPVPMLLLVVTFRERWTWRHLSLYVVLAAVAAAVSLFWLLPTLSGLPYMTQDPPPFWLNTSPLKVFTDYLTPWAGFQPVMMRWRFGTLFTRQALLLLALLGFWRLWRDGHRRRVYVLGGAAAFFAVFAYLGSHVPVLRTVEPYRYSIWMNFLLLVPASVTLDAFLRPGVRARRLPSPRSRAAVVLGALLALNLLPSCHALLELHPRRTVARGYLDDFLALEAWISEHTDPASRILIEDAYAPFLQGREGPYRDSYPLGILALETGREFLSGRYPFYRISYRYASFSGGKALGRRIADVPPEAFRRALDLYNCGWIIAWDPRSVGILRERFPFLEEVETVGPFVIFRVRDAVRDYFVRGSGRVHRSYGGLVLEDLRPEEGAVVIKYHYVPGLRSEPPCEIEEIDLTDAPHGFVRIVDPPDRLRLLYP